MNEQTTHDFDLEFTEATTDPVKVALEGDDLPEKYRGKSPAELAEMHANLEKRFSQQGNELGTIRRLADQLLELKGRENVGEPKKEPPKPVTVDEIFADPDRAIKQAVTNSDVAQQAQNAADKVNQIERQLALQTFESKYPSYRQDLNDQAFQNWISNNPARAELFRRADKFDVASADALWQMWGEYKELKSITEKRDAAKEKRQEALKAGKTVQEAPLDTGAKGTIYSRAKLMELQAQAHSGNMSARSRWNDAAFQDELLRAYSEGRVR